MLVNTNKYMHPRLFPAHMNATNNRSSSLIPYCFCWCSVDQHAIRFINFLNGWMTFSDFFPIGELPDSTTSDRHLIVFDFSTPPPVKYAPHSSLSLRHNYLIHSWSICVCFHGHSPRKGLTQTVSPLSFLCTCSTAALDSVWGANPAKPKQILSWFALSMLSDEWVKTILHVSRDLLRTTVKDRSCIFTRTDSSLI